MATLRDLEERRRTLATLDDEKLVPPDPRKHGGMGHSVVIAQSTRQAAAVKEFQKDFGPTSDIVVPTDPEARQRWFVEGAAREGRRVEAERLQIAAARQAQAETERQEKERARLQREAAERTKAEQGRQIVDGVLKAAARQEILDLIATMSAAEEDAVAKHVQAMGNAYLALPLAWSAVRAGDGQPRKPALQAVETPTTPTEGPASSASMRTALQDVADDIESKGKKIYSQLDKASGGRFQRYTDNLDKINDRLGNLVEGVDDDEIERLEQKKNEVETSQAQMFDDLQGDGVNSDLAKAANAHWRQAQALKDVQRAIGTSTKGNSAFGEKEIVNPSQLVTKLEKLNARPNKGVPSRLEQAVGPEGADALMKEAYAAVKAKRLQTAAKWSAGISSLVFGGSGYLHHLLTAAVLP